MVEAEGISSAPSPDHADRVNVMMMMVADAEHAVEGKANVGEAEDSFAAKSLFDALATNQDAASIGDFDWNARPQPPRPVDDPIDPLRRFDQFTPPVERRTKFDPMFNHFAVLYGVDPLHPRKLHHG